MQVFRQAIGFFFALAPVLCWAQNATIKGFVEDAATGEPVIGANVYDAATFHGTTTNAYGFFSLTLPTGEVVFTVSYVGFNTQAYTLELISDTTINIRMEGSVALKAVEITATRGEEIQERSQMSTIEVPVAAIQNLPALLGEKDVLKTIQLLPGVQSGSEGQSGLYVRGGGPDQNLILLDGVPVYNASHLFGFFSVFNPDAINSVELIKGGFPAHYGGRLSSVVDIRMKEGNMQEFQGQGSVGLVSSKLTVEGPILKDRASFIVSGRRTYIDLLARPIIKRSFRAAGGEGVAGYYFYDLNGKVNYKISPKDRIFLSAYLGNDEFYLNTENSYPAPPFQVTETNRANLGWGNITSALRYNRVFGNKLFANLTATYSRYDFNIGQRMQSESEPETVVHKQDLSLEYGSGIYDWSGKIDFDYLPSPSHYVRFGISDIYHTFVPGISVYESSTASDGGIDTTFGAVPVFAHEYAAYLEDDIKFSTRLKANIGLHLSGFISGKSHYKSLQPRASLRYLINESWSVKASYAEMQQYIHLLTNATIGLPTDLWVPATSKVPPQYARQGAVGFAKTWRNAFEISVEGYYKTMDGLIEYKEGAGFFSGGANWEEQIEKGKGWSYGAELFVQKKVGKTSGWVGYTLSWTTRYFENLNFGRPFPYKFDRRHDVSIVLIHKFSDRFDLGATWVYGTGNAVSLATVRYKSVETGHAGLGNMEIEYIADRNDFRMNAYHRLDVGLNFRKPKSWGERAWSLGVYNAYSRKNPFYLYFDHDRYGNQVLRQISLFPIIPYITYSFKF